MADALVKALAHARSVFVLTGAGISAESGLATFRGQDGHWQRHRVEDLASPEGFARDPLLVWRWYNERIAACTRAEPNAGHRALAELASLIPRLTLATQNVDSLHVRAGTQGLLELHGHLREARCTGCGATQSLAGGMPEDRILHGCGGRFRPAVVWFGEMLPQRTFAAAQAAAEDADVILVVGTSAQVYPAAALAMRNGSAYLAEINPGATGISARCDATIREGAATALPQIVRALRSLR